MKQEVFRADVEQAIESLKKAGKNLTIKAIHAALGGRGSITTLVRLKGEIDAESAALRDSQEALRIFREFWKLAVQEGRSQKEAEVEEVRETIDAVTTEMQALEAAAAAARESLSEVSRQRDNLVEELTKLHDELAAARTASEQHSRKLGDVVERTAKLETEAAELRRRLGVDDAELAKAKEEVASARASADRYSGDLAGALGKIERLRASHEQEANRLRAQLCAEQQRANRLEIELAKAETWMESKRGPFMKKLPNSRKNPNNSSKLDRHVRNGE